MVTNNTCHVREDNMINARGIVTTTSTLHNEEKNMYTTINVGREVKHSVRRHVGLGRSFGFPQDSATLRIQSEIICDGPGLQHLLGVGEVLTQISP